MKGEPVFDGSHLRATLFNPDGAGLFVTFQHRRPRPGQFEPVRAKQGALDAGMAHLHIQTRLNDWYIGPDTRPLEGALRGLAPRYDTVLGQGFSMGGYGAFRFAGALGMTKVLAVSPQYSIAPAHVPFDRRFLADAGGFDPDLGHLDPRGTAMQGLILTDPFRPLDMRNAWMICAVFPGVRIARLAGGGHPASRALREGGQFGALQDQLFEPGAGAKRLLARHRLARRDSPTYWRNLASRAQRSGRDGLAQRALARAAVLEHAATRHQPPESLDATGDTA